MTSTGVSAIENSLQAFTVWLREIEQSLGCSNREQAYRALRAVLHGLRDQLTLQEAAQLSAQLPTVVRGIYWEGWRPNGKPSRRREDFLEHLAAALANNPAFDLEEIARGVFHVIASHVSQGEIEDICGSLPKGIRELLAPAFA